MTRAVLIDALREVYDPCCADRGINIVDMGVVEDVRQQGSHVEVDLVLTTGWCPFVATNGHQPVVSTRSTSTCEPCWRTSSTTPMSTMLMPRSAQHGS